MFALFNLKNKQNGINVPKYILAQRQWNFQIMNSYWSLLLWQIAAVALLIIFVFTLFFTFNYIAQPKLIPYVVTIDDKGEVNYKGVIKNEKLTITDTIIRYYINRFISDLRTISSDVVVLKKQLKDAYFLSTPSCQHQLTELIKKALPFEALQAKIRVDIRFVLYERVAESTWRCQWEEIIREDGVFKDKKMMAATVSYTSIYPENEEVAEINPFGIYFSDLFITEVRL